MSFLKQVFTKANSKNVFTYLALLLGGVILGVGLSEPSFAVDVGPMHTTRFRCLIARLTYLLEGNFGALILVGAGVGTVISMMAGAYKAAATLFTVAALAFVMRSLVVIFFAGDPYGVSANCNPGAGINMEGVADSDQVSPPGGFDPDGGQLPPPVGFDPDNGQVAPPGGFNPGTGQVAPPSGFNPGEGQVAPPIGLRPDEGNQVLPPEDIIPGGGPLPELELPSESPTGGYQPGQGYTFGQAIPPSMPYMPFYNKSLSNNNFGGSKGAVVNDLPF